MTQLDALLRTEALECLVDELRATVRVQPLHLASELSLRRPNDVDHGTCDSILRQQASEPTMLAEAIRHRQAVFRGRWQLRSRRAGGLRHRSLREGVHVQHLSLRSA